MKIRILLFSVFLLSFLVLFHTHFQNRQLNCPSEVHAVVPSITLPSLNISLKANLEIYAGSSASGSPLQTQEIAVSFIPKQNRRSQSPQLISIASTPLPALTPGTYTFRINLRRQSDDLPIARLELTQAVNTGSTVNLDQATWNYDFDEDGDHYNNLTEIINGEFSAPPASEIASIWTAALKNPLASADHPDHVILLRPSAISAMKPGPNGRLRVVGDPYSVQSGVLVKADLLNSGGTLKNSADAPSRIDGSFDLTFSGGAVAGDRVIVYAVSRRDQASNPEFDSSRSVTGPGSKVELQVGEAQTCQ